MENIIAFIQTNIYLQGSLYVIGFAVGARIIAWVLARYVFYLTRKTKTKVDDMVAQKLEPKVSLLIFMYGIELGVRYFPELPFSLEALEKTIDTIIIIIWTIVLMGVSDILIETLGSKWAERTSSKTDDNILHFVAKFVGIIIGVFGLAFILKVWGVEVTALLGGLGIGGLALAFGVQKTLENVFGGISLVLDKTIAVGDVIELENGATSGTVYDIGLRSTKIKTWDNEIVVIPNSQMANSKILNRVLPDKNLRIQVPFHVPYGEDAEKVKAVVIDIIKEKIPNLLEDQGIMVRLNNMSHWSLDFTAYFWIKNYEDRATVKDIANSAIYEGLEDKQIIKSVPSIEVTDNDSK